MNAVSIDVDMLASLPVKTLLRHEEKRRATAKNLAAAFATIQRHSSLFGALEALDIDVTFAPEHESMPIDLRFAGDGDRLGEVWGLLRAAGYAVNKRPEKGDTQFSGYWRKDGEAGIYMYFTSTLCKRVQVGTRLVEQPVYETQCGTLPELPTGATDVVPF